MPSELGKLIRAEREKRRIGLREFAGKVGKSPAFIVRLETDNELPSATEETLVTVARALSLDENIVLALAKIVPKALAPETSLDLAAYRKVKNMTQEAKRRFVDGTGDETKGNR